MSHFALSLQSLQVLNCTSEVSVLLWVSPLAGHEVLRRARMSLYAQTPASESSVHPCSPWVTFLHPQDPVPTNEQPRVMTVTSPPALSSLFPIRAPVTPSEYQAWHPRGQALCLPPESPAQRSAWHMTLTLGQ